MELTRHRVVLRGDRAYSMDEYSGECPVQILDLGLESSYGSHVLDIDLQDGWAGLAVVGYFDNGEDCADSLLDNGVMEVPPSASKNPGTHTITFTGSDSEGYRVSTKIPYRILPKGCTTGSTPPPDPDVFQQFVEQLIAALDDYFVGGNLNDVWTKITGGKQGWAKPQDAGSKNYNDLNNKPQINGNELIGNKTWQQLGFPDVQALADAAAQSAREALDAAAAAAGSASAAQGSASTAATKASEAGASAQAAAQSASDAEQSKTAAAGSASNADQSAQQASGSASAAAGDADRAAAAAGKIPDPTGVPDAYLASNPEATEYKLIPTSEIVQEVLAALPNGDEVSY